VNHESQKSTKCHLWMRITACKQQDVSHIIILRGLTITFSDICDPARMGDRMLNMQGSLKPLDSYHCQVSQLGTQQSACKLQHKSHAQPKNHFQPDGHLNTRNSSSPHPGWFLATHHCRAEHAGLIPHSVSTQLGALTFQSKLISNPGSFPTQAHSQPRLISNPGSFPTQAHFQSKLISNPSSFATQAHFQPRLISNPGSFPTQDHFQPRIISNPSSFPTQAHFQPRLISNLGSFPTQARQSACCTLNDQVLLPTCAANSDNMPLPAPTSITRLPQKSTRFSMIAVK